MSHNKPQRRVTGVHKTESHSQAFELATQTSMTYKEIAERVGVAPATVGKWAKAGQWEIIQAARNVTKGKIVKDYYLQLDALNKKIGEREDGERFPTAAEADVIKKTTAAIRDLEGERTLSVYVTTFEEFGDYLKASGATEMLQALIDHQRSFLTAKAKELK